MTVLSGPGRPVNVFVVAPLLLCWGLEKLVNAGASGFRIIATDQSVEDALQALQHVHAHVVVVDGQVGPNPAQLEQLTGMAPVLLLTADPEGSLTQALTPYVAAVARHSDSPALVLRAIERAWRSRRPRRGHYAMLGAAKQEHGDSEAHETKISRLTAREKTLMVAMMCNDVEPGKVIANRLCISEHTLRNHLSSIYGKLGVQNRLGLHAFGAKYGLYRLATGKGPAVELASSHSE